MSVQFLVLAVPVLLGFMGFALDLGRMYLIRSELNQAASAMALAAATKLNGTVGALDNATLSANLTLDNTLGDGNRYNFGSIGIGLGNALLTSTISDPAYFPDVASAIAAAGQNGVGSTADGTTARHVTINLAADSPLLFWGLLTLGQSRKTSIAATAVAGVSAPLCMACGVDPIAVAAINLNDTTNNFGFVQGTIYTFAQNCTGNPTLLTGSTASLKYLVLDRYDSSSSYGEDGQLYRDGAQGLIPNTNINSNNNTSYACVRNYTSDNYTSEAVWATTSTGTRTCTSTTVNSSIEDLMCGLTTRGQGGATVSGLTACQNITNIGTLTQAYNQDTDVTYVTDYTQYVGDGVRLLNIPVVDALSTTGSMNVQGFVQFLLEPLSDGVTWNNPADGPGRFSAMYLGIVAPISQGRFDGCGSPMGPGKVVLHQ